MTSTPRYTPHHPTGFSPSTPVLFRASAGGGEGEGYNKVQCVGTRRHQSGGKMPSSILFGLWDVSPCQLLALKECYLRSLQRLTGYFVDQTMLLGFQELGLATLLMRRLRRHIERCLSMTIAKRNVDLSSISMRSSCTTMSTGLC